MESMKKTYYVDLVSGDVLSRPAIEENPSFKIEATDEELHELKTLLSESYDADMQSYVRAQIPYIEYHKDPANHRYDDALKKIYAIIYQLGDEAARNHVIEMGILGEDKLQQDEEIQKFT
ncbi:hydrolase [Bacillus sp. V59.32b]|uniref:hydrolase n=1 Tax=Bacillus sp. V59.32b TaxID=1758642 RepID=UPI000E3B8228|nr:hydrolase [Bacillus sp. V59.32b]RFU62686.1 hydrolase [Bacillus sp. V59.32b]